MGKLVVSEFISLDGVIEDPGGAEGTEKGGWSFRFPAPEGQEYKMEELRASDVQLLGRVTYQEFAAAWPGMREAAGEFGEKMNAMPKVVVSATLTDPAWRTRRSSPRTRRPPWPGSRSSTRATSSWPAAPRSSTCCASTTSSTSTG